MLKYIMIVLIASAITGAVTDDQLGSHSLQLSSRDYSSELLRAYALMGDVFATNPSLGQSASPITTRKYHGLDAPLVMPDIGIGEMNASEIGNVDFSKKMDWKM
jgi:hypothetical protein